MAVVTDSSRRRARPHPRRHGRFLTAVWTLATIVGLNAPATAARSAPAEPRPAVAQEYDLKAAFLFNFAQFVDWPPDAFPAATTPITIGVLGEDPFGASLDLLLAGETIHNRQLLVRRYQSVDQVDSCHILFISTSEASQLNHIFKVLARRSILTVGETQGFAAHAGVVGFALSKRRLRLEINTAAATAARLTISSKLLRQALIVRSSGGQE